MPIYAIGDVQGCYQSLISLLDKIKFNSAVDQLWFTGDLVNRGRQNLETLRLVKTLGDAAVSVLGNHDLHLLAVAYGHRQIQRRSDTFDDVMAAADCDDLIEWLRRRPVIHHDAARNFIVVHAGLPPQWNLARAMQCADELQQVLRGQLINDFLANMYGNQPDLWSDTLQGWERLRYITNSFTRIRYCDREGREDFQHNREPGTQPPHLMPWFKAPNRMNRDVKIIFGHWAALGQHKDNNAFALDSGCVWGGKLTAMKIADKPVFYQVDC